MTRGARMQLETILYEKQDGVATITLNRAERHNAFTLAMSPTATS